MLSPPFVLSFGFLLTHHVSVNPLAFAAALAEPPGSSQKGRRREVDG